MKKALFIVIIGIAFIFILGNCIVYGDEIVMNDSEKIIEYTPFYYIAIIIIISLVVSISAIILYLMNKKYKQNDEKKNLKGE